MRYFYLRRKPSYISQQLWRSDPWLTNQFNKSAYSKTRNTEILTSDKGENKQDKNKFQLKWKTNNQRFLIAPNGPQFTGIRERLRDITRRVFLFIFASRKLTVAVLRPNQQKPKRYWIRELWNYNKTTDRRSTSNQFLNHSTFSSITKGLFDNRCRWHTNIGPKICRLPDLTNKKHQMEQNQTSLSYNVKI